MNKINEINQRELENGVLDSGSWHNDYKDSNYIFIGGLEPSLKEKDILVIFSQYGLPTHIKLVKDEQNESKGFAYLKYKDFKSCVLAIDNFNGIVVYDKKIRVDHCWFRLRDNEQELDYLVDYDTLVPKPKQIAPRAPEAEKNVEKLDFSDIIDDDLVDPMANFNKRQKI